MTHLKTMKIKGNFKVGEVYYFVPKSTTACVFLGKSIARLMKIAYIPCYIDRPKNVECHRVRVEVVRTNAEQAIVVQKLKNAFRRMRYKNAKHHRRL